MKQYEIEVTVWDGKNVLFVQSRHDGEDDDKIMLSIDQLPGVIAELQRIVDEKA